MGCICSKEGSDSDEGYGRDKESRSSKRLWIGNEKPGEDEDEDEDVNAMILVKSSKSHNPTKNNGKSRRGHTKMSRVASMPNGDEATWIAAGWPSWLTAVAGDAISGLVPRGADTFEKLEKIGQGTYSSVYKARDVESGKLVAMKKVRFANMDPESVRFMAREIRILRKLNHPNVMKLECLVTSRVSSSLYLVFEYMEHDLTGLAARPGVKFTESQIKCYMQQLFHGLEHCHSHGVLHRDIKGSNLLIDNDGNLKIADFGLATSFHHNQKQPLTSRVVTLWYRPPELLLGSTDYGVAVDLWSAGCILAELFNGKPIMPGRTEVEQLHKIFKICGSPSVEHWQKSRLPYATMFKPQRPYSRRLVETFKDFPSSALTLLDVLLHVEPEHRGSASLALESEFFTSKPLPCDPSTLPKYPPSKEFDVRLRDEEARRRKADAKGLGQVVKKEGRKTQFVPVPEANAELKVSIQGHYVLPKPKSNSEKLNRGEDAASGFRIDPPRGLSQNDIAHSLQLLASKSFSQPHKMQGRADEIPAQPVQTPMFHASQRLFKLSRFASSIGYAGGAEVNDQHDERSSNKDDSKHSKIASNIEDGHPHREGFKMEYAPVDQLHRSGPLLPAEENIHEMLKENEKKIQQVIRKARFDRTRNAFPDNVQSEFVLT